VDYHGGGCSVAVLVCVEVDPKSLRIATSKLLNLVTVESVAAGKGYTDLAGTQGCGVHDSKKGPVQFLVISGQARGGLNGM
jgi:hypothetical protein